MPVSSPPHPCLSGDDALRLAREVWGFEASSARALPSERDQNFLLAREGADPTARVLKAAGPDESDGVLDLQDRALGWLAERAPELPVPRHVPAGGRIGVERGGLRLRLLTYLPGTTLAEARPRHPALLESLGRMLGRLDAALSGFTHPAAQGRALAWNPDHALDVIAEHAGGIADPDRRRLVEDFVRLFQETAAPRLPGLPRGVIHNDANDHNVLVGPPAAVPWERAVTGLLDFGDLVQTWVVCEVSVAAAYGMFGQADPLAAASRLAAGYHAGRALSEDELACLWPLAALRLCTSVCLSAHRRASDPGNPYLVISETPAWETLWAMRSVHPRFAHYALRAACGFSPCPDTPALEAWLGSRPRGDFAPLVGAELSRAVVFDLSVSSPEFRSPDETTNTAAMTPRLFARLEEAGAEAGIGRYDEARLVYGGDTFAGTSGEHPERRTVHLAWDVFVPPGTPVFAPLGGRVHAARDNAARWDYGPTIILEHAPEGAPRFYTLYGHLAPDSLERRAPGAPIARGERIGSVGSPPRNGDWPPHVHFQIVTDLLDRDGDFNGAGEASRREVWLSLSPDPGLILSGRPEFRAPREDPRSLAQARSRLLGPSLSLAYRRPLEIVRGAGTFLYDQTGGAFLDMVNNVAHVGHAHPRVVDAAARQMRVLNTNTRYLHPSILRYAQRLAQMLPDPLSVCVFVCSGSEANELALRMARARTGRRAVIAVAGSYHGNTQALIEVSPYKFDGRGGGGRPEHTFVVPMPDDYRGLYRRDDPRRGEKFAAHVARAAEASHGSGAGPAAFLCESLLSCGGQIELPPGYLAAAYRHAREAGAVCIADEVQVGFGRVGSRFWGFQTQGEDVVPDIVTLGKPIGNGHPLAAVVTTAEIAAAFANGMEYFNTFGGNPVSCEIGLAVLDVIRDEGLQERARRVGGRLRDGLEDLMSRHEAVGDVRGLGLFLGIELVADRAARTPAAAKAAYVVERMKEHGILLSTDGPDHNVVKMKPPLCFGDDEADRAVAAFDRVLGEDFVRGQ